MRIATFNLESLDLGRKASAELADRLPVLRPQLMRLEADILCLQEVNGQHRAGRDERTLEALEELLESTPYAKFHRVSTTGPGGVGVRDVHNLVTLSRWPIVMHRELQNSLCPALSYSLINACPPIGEPILLSFDRPVLECAIEPETGPGMTIFNVHFRAPLALPVPGQKESPFVWKSVAGWAEGYFLSGIKRSAQALETRLAIDQLMDAQPQRAIVVAGDFNSEDHETPLKIMVGAEEDTGNGRLEMRTMAVLDRSVAEDRRFTVLHHGRPQMLDHILVSRPLLGRFRSIEVHNETLCDEAIGYAKTQRPTGSYHAPLVAVFSDVGGQFTELT